MTLHRHPLILDAHLCYAHLDFWAMEQQRTFSDFCREYWSSSSSIQSLPHLARASSWPRRLVWLTILLLGTGVTVAMIWSLLADYLKYEITVSSWIEHGAPPFPDVTICNLNPLWMADASDFSMEEQSSRVMSEIWARAVEEEGEAQAKGLLLPLLTTGGFLQSLDRSVIQDAAQRSHFILGCAHIHADQQMTSECPWDLLHVPSHGPCFSLHSPPDTVKLSVLLHLNDFPNKVVSNFFLNPTGSYASGARVFIHPNNSYPIVSEGITVSPGHEVTLQAQAFHHQNLPPPYSICASSVNYSSAATCASLCAQQNIASTCNCLDFHHMLPPEEENDPLLPFCGSVHHVPPEETLQHLRCVRDAVPPCDCPAPCESTSFQLDAHQAAWPHEAFHLSLYTNLIQGQEAIAPQYKAFADKAFQLHHSNESELLEYLRQETIIRRNFIQVNVELNKDGIQKCVESPASSVIPFLVYSGGILNLCLGISSFTAIECIDFVLLAVCFCCRRKKSLDKVKQKENMNSNQAWSKLDFTQKLDLVIIVNDLVSLVQRVSFGQFFFVKRLKKIFFFNVFNAGLICGMVHCFKVDINSLNRCSNLSVCCMAFKRAQQYLK